MSIKTIRTLGIVLAATMISLPATAQDAVTLKLWTVPGHDLGAEETQRELFAKFEEMHPNIKIDLTVMPESGYEDRMTTVLGAGSGAPDLIVFFDNNWLPQALDLTDYIEADPDISPDKYYTEFWNNRVVDGDRIVALPYGIGANIVLYNKDVFDAAGVAYPTADWTTEDFISIAKSVTDKSKGIWGGDRPRGAFRAVFNNYGALPYSDDSTSVDGHYNSDASVAAFTWLWDLVDSGATPTPAEIDILGTEGTGPVDLFISGRLAMATLNQTHLLTSLKQGVNFGVVPEPKGPGPVRHVNAWSARPGIWQGTEHPEEAWELLKFWAGAEGQRYMMENGLNMFPAIPSVIEGHPFADHEGTKAFFSVLEWPQVAGWQSKHPCWRAAVRRVGDTWDLINLGEIGRDEIRASLDKDLPELETALNDCVPRLGG